MDLIKLNKKFNTKAKCLDYLIKLRWGKTVICPKCKSKKVVSLKSQKGRYHCYNCKTTFSVLTDTIFEYTGLSMQKWFTIIALMTNAKRGISAKDIERNAGVTYKTAWYSAMRIRCAMIDHCNIVLENFVEMDEAYVGGKPRKKAKKQQKVADSKPSISTLENVKRGRGTKKTPIVGIVERNGDVVVKVIEKLTFRNLSAMLKEHVNTEKATLITDEYKGYSPMDDIIEHFVIKHSKEFTRGAIHTNTIEGFWSIIKNSIKGNHIKISKKYLPFYLLNAQYIYNHRNYRGNLFEKFLKEALRHDKPMEHYKPIKDVKEIVYKSKKSC